ncbi:hypothetical protein [Hymenobacter crusticola]|uniref:Lipocalin-like domain-containing protein n=1 Tax=Hymenobacter crusticola TaxID=1770526 RepID=A0A243WH19_9BACT|nr:hypothetical protein [Hymenobacter crusticola]OUJ74251.1 hypothetical protein BXP70_11030 [Hymenobacter crusticola]
MISSLFSMRAAASLLVLTSLIACSKKDAEPEYVGTSWTADGKETKIPGGSTQVNASTIDLSINQAGVGNGPVSDGLYLVIPKSVGTYDLATSRNGAQASYASDKLYTATSGTITVTTLTATTLKGTFTFTGTDKFSTPSTTKTITNGKFNRPL